MGDPESVVTTDATDDGIQEVPLDEDGDEPMLFDKIGYDEEGEAFNDEKCMLKKLTKLYMIHTWKVEVKNMIQSWMNRTQHKTSWNHRELQTLHNWTVGVVFYLQYPFRSYSQTMFCLESTLSVKKGKKTVLLNHS